MKTIMQIMAPIGGFVAGFVIEALIAAAAIAVIVLVLKGFDFSKIINIFKKKQTAEGVTEDQALLPLSVEDGSLEYVQGGSAEQVPPREEAPAEEVVYEETAPAEQVVYEEAAPAAAEEPVEEEEQIEVYQEDEEEDSGKRKKKKGKKAAAAEEEEAEEASETEVVYVQEGIVFNDKKTVTELYDELTAEQKGYFDELREEALTKPDAELAVARNFITVKIGKRNLIKLLIKRGVTVAEFMLENEALKALRLSNTNKRGKSSIKVKPTVVQVIDLTSLKVAIDMISLAYEELMLSD